MVSTSISKEGFELLRGSSDNHSDSDISEIIFPVKKKRFRRRLKNDSKFHRKESKHHCNCKTRSIIFTLFSFILICWLLTLTWLTVELHNELNRLSSQVSEVNVPLQGGKKMKKRKELDALVSKTINKRSKEEGKRTSSGGNVSIHDKLLSDSTDDPDYWASSVMGKPFRNQRRQYLARKRTCLAFLKACSAVVVCACMVATATVIWLFVDVREQVTSLRTELNQVVAGIQGVPDAMQKCHTFSKDLQKNQTRILNRLSGFSLQLSNFSLEMTEVKLGLQTVQDQVKSSPDLVNNPRLIKYLSDSVASFGSQIRDLNSTVTTLKDHNGKVDNVISELVNNLTKININLTDLSRDDIGRNILTGKKISLEKEAILALVTQVSRNLSVINDTLSSKLLWTAEDQSKDHKLIESLQEMNENITTRVKTLEGLCAKKSDNSSEQILPNLDSNHHTMQLSMSSPSSKKILPLVEKDMAVGSKFKNITLKK